MMMKSKGSSPFPLSPPLRAEYPCRARRGGIFLAIGVILIIWGIIVIATLTVVFAQNESFGDDSAAPAVMVLRYFRDGRLEGATEVYGLTRAECLARAPEMLEGAAPEGVALTVDCVPFSTDSPRRPTRPEVHT